MSTIVSLSEGLSNAFVGLPIPWEQYQHELGVRFTREYSILSSNLTLGMYRFTSHDVYNGTSYMNRDPI